MLGGIDGIKFLTFYCCTGSTNCYWQVSIKTYLRTIFPQIGCVQPIFFRHSFRGIASLFHPLLGVQLPQACVLKCPAHQQASPMMK